MNYKNVLNKRKRNRIVKEVMKELKLTLKDINQFIPYDEIYDSMKKAVYRDLKKREKL